MRFRPLVLAVTTAALIAPAAAAAQGTTALDLGDGARSLKSQKVKLKAGAPARLKGTRLTLPVSDGVIASSAVLVHAGSLRLQRGKRKLTIKSVRLSIGSPARVSARVDNRPMTLFTVTGGARFINGGGGAVRLSGGRLTLASGAAKAIRKRLNLRKLPRVFGLVGTDARVTPSAGGSTGPEPAGAARPATAVDITAATIDWHVRDSFVCYLASGEGATALAPAVALAPVVPSCSDNGSHVYDFRLPFRAGGWYDPVSETALVLGAGGVRFQYSGHGIDIQAYDPEIEINGGSSRAIFRFAGGGRGVLMNLAVSAVTPSVSGTTHTYTSVPGSVPDGASGGIFAGFYPAGAPFGWMTVSFTTP